MKKWTIYYVKDQTGRTFFYKSLRNARKGREKLAKQDSGKLEIWMRVYILNSPDFCAKDKFVEA